MARVLLVEDDASTRSVLEAILRYDAHEVHLAANGKQALMLAKEKSPDIVLSDIHMPGMSGIEFCRALRQDPAVADTYVILATGFDSPETRTEGIASGADDYIGKPIRAEELGARVRIGLRMRPLRRELADLQKKVGDAEKGRTEVDRAAARVVKLRADLTESLGLLLGQARALRDACLQGDPKGSLSRAEDLVRGLEDLRTRVAPSEGP